MSKKEIEELESEAGIGTVEKSFNSTTTAPVAAAPAAAEKLPSKEVIVDFNSMDLAVAFPRRLTVLRIILFFLCTISTGGIYLLVASFYPRVLAAVVLGKTSADKATFFLTRALDGRYSISRVRNTKVNRSETIRWYSHRQIRYVWSAEANDFIKSEWDIKKPFAFIHANLVGGVDEAEYNRRVVLYGSNLIKIPIKNLPHHIISEAFHPFYLFQLFSTILWIIEEYTTYSICIIVISFISFCWEIISARYDLYRLQKLARSETTITVLRKGAAPQAISSLHLVPGDIVELEANMSLPCDVLLLSGECIVAESMLTGEAIPVVKQPLPPTSPTPDVEYSPDTHKKHTLYCGTHIIQTKKVGTAAVSGVVVRTNFYTTKGRLFRTILYPKPLKLNFFRDSLVYLIGMGALAIAAFLKSLIEQLQHGIPLGDIIVHSLDLVTIAIPPALPLVLTAGVGFSMFRLRFNKILCISPSRINYAGKVNYCCFDKTGTITEDVIKVEGVRPVQDRERYAPMIATTDGNIGANGDSPIVRVLASCHSLSLLSGSLSGHPVDLEMFKSTNWTLSEPQNDNEANKILALVSSPTGSASAAAAAAARQLAILHRFDFEAKLQRMSAIIQDQKTGNYELCVKGSPEAIRSLSDPSTIPAEFETVLDHYTKKGNYVLGLAIRSLPDFDRSSLRQLTRDDLERNLAFCGLLVFSNQLKPDSKAAIKTLNEANITSVIITGDNALTAITVAKEVGIIRSNSKVILAEGTKDGTNIIWTDTDTQADLEYETIERIIQNKKQKQQHSKNKSKSYKYGVREETELSSSINNYEGEVDFAITAKALAVLMRSSLFGEIVDKVKIWARVTPEQKTALVEKLIDCGYYVGMCGDGANDCGALRAAHVGLALSDAEASIVAPFTAKKRVISDMVALLKEGRCALTTSFSAFRYMALYPMVQLFSALRLYQVKSILGNNQYLYDDLAIVLPLSMTMLLALPYHKLTKRTPTASLLSPSILLSILGQVFIQIAFLVAANELLRAQSWFCPLPTEEKQPDDPCPIEPALDDLATPCYENTVTWTYCNFQYIITAVTMSAGTPFRMPVFLNLPFTFWLVLSFGLAWYFIVGPTAHTIAAFELVEIPDASFGWKLFGVMLANFAASLIWDWLICNGPVGDHLGRLWDRWWARLRNNNNKKNKRGSLLGDAH